MLSPEPEANDLIEKMTPCVDDPRVFLSDFELELIARKARKITERDQGLLIEGMAYLAAGYAEKGIELCERSILLNKYSTVAWVNYSMLLGNRGYHYLKKEVLERAVELDIVLMHSIMLSCSAFWLWEESFERSLNFLIKSNSLEQALTEHQREEVSDMLSRKENLPVISPFAQIAFEIADSERLLTFNNYICTDKEFGFHYSLSIDCDDAAKLFYLNKLAVKKIIEKNLHHLDCTIVFVSEGGYGR